MINAVWFAERELPSARLMTALGLYFDHVAIPLSRTVPDSRFGRFFRALPPTEKGFLEANLVFIDNYKELSPALFTFPNPIASMPDEIQQAHLSDLSKLMRSIPEHAPQPLILPLTQFSFAVGLYHGMTDADAESNTSRLIIPLSEREMFGAPPYPTVYNKRYADILASWLAIETTTLYLPELEIAHPSEILHARETLAEELKSFRMAMYGLARNLRELVEESASVEKIRLEASFLAKTTVQPAVHALQKRLEIERKSFARRLILKTVGMIGLAVNYCLSPDPLKVARLASDTAKGFLDFSEYCDEIGKLENKSALSYLVKLPKQFSKPRKSPER